jgi:hypothetical protein
MGGEVRLEEGFMEKHGCVNRAAAYILQQLMAAAAGTIVRPQHLLQRYLHTQVTHRE